MVDSMVLKLKKPSKIEAIASVIQYLMYKNPKIENEEIIQIIMKTLDMSENQARINYFDAIEKILRDSISSIV
jgi:energy-converting hydrogenase A subunit M